jgi:hypothetical protein
MWKPLQTALAIAATCAGVSTLSGQTLQSGTWTGTMKPPNEPAATVTFQVTGTGDSLAISMVLLGVDSTAFSEIRWQAGKLLFQWHAGDLVVKCELSKQDSGGYRGPCTDDKGMTGQMDMIPPSKP